MTQLGKAISILVSAERIERDMHDDVDAWGAPGECHDLVARGEGKRLRHARRRALHAAGVNSMRVLRARVRRVCTDAYFYKRYGYVPY
jgi:hypothetical protein